LLYVGLTRAKYCCWLGVANIRGVADSAFASLMSVSGKGEALAESLQNAIEKLNQSEAIALETVGESSAPVKKIAVTETPLIPARQLERAVVQDRWWVTSYSAIASRVESSHASDAFDESLALSLASEQDNGAPINSAINEFEQAKAGTIHAFERGAVPGNFLHELLESAALLGFEKVSQDSTLLETLLPLESLPERWQAERGMLLDWLQATLVADLQLGSRSQLRSLQLYQPEMEFLFAAHEVDLEQLDALCHQAINPELQRPKLKHEQVNGMLKGFIDLTFVDNEQYWVCDYKSNWLGPDVHSYDMQAMSQALVEHRYDLQLMIYLLALHRMLLARDSEYRANPALGYETRVGGALYVYLRGFPEGAGVLKNRPDYQFVEQMDRLFRGEG
ncbi:MAG: exodeoxyribonuclease subunit beta, partial [Pseudomonadota bacterium]